MKRHMGSAVAVICVCSRGECRRACVSPAASSKASPAGSSLLTFPYARDKGTQASDSMMAASHRHCVLGTSCRLCEPPRGGGWLDGRGAASRLPSPMLPTTRLCRRKPSTHMSNEWHVQSINGGTHATHTYTCRHNMYCTTRWRAVQPTCAQAWPQRAAQHVGEQQPG